MLDGLRARRDRLIATPRFRAWAASFPLTRPIARRRTRALFDLCAGFVYAQILQACIELDLFAKLADGPSDADTLAPALGLSPDRTLTLLEAAASLRLLARRSKNRFGLGDVGAAMVGNSAVSAMVAHHGMLYADLADPVALLRAPAGQTRLSGYWAYAPDGDDVAKRGYTALMAESQALVAGEILAAYDVSRHARLMDVGGGSGRFLQEAARRAPSLSLILFDLPSVADAARERFAEAGLAARATAVGGSFLTDTLPLGTDLVSLVRVVHDHDDADATRILQAVHAALPVGGTLLLAEPMADTPGAEPIGHAYFGFYLLAMGRGRPRSAATLTAMLRAAGFVSVRSVRTNTPLLVSLLVATA